MGDLYYTIPPRPRSNARALSDLIAAYSTAALRPPIGKGDKVRVTVEGYVTVVNGDGTVNLSTSRGPFDDAFTTNVPRSACTLLEFAPAEPMVGDTITGQQVIDTPWRRGTVIRRGENGSQFALLASGQWIGVNEGGLFDFDGIERAGRFTVEYAPGKKTRDG